MSDTPGEQGIVYDLYAPNAKNLSDPAVFGGMGEATACAAMAIIEFAKGATTR